MPSVEGVSTGPAPAAGTPQEPAPDSAAQSPAGSVPVVPEGQDRLKSLEGELGRLRYELGQTRRTNADLQQKLMGLEEATRRQEPPPKDLEQLAAEGDVVGAIKAATEPLRGELEQLRMERLMQAELSEVRATAPDFEKVAGKMRELVKEDPQIAGVGPKRLYYIARGMLQEPLVNPAQPPVTHTESPTQAPAANPQLESQKAFDRAQRTGQWTDWLKTKPGIRRHLGG